ncbi:MAG: hypothetical protein ACLUNO_07355 [Oscillospiraceae bacterium]
MLEAPYRFTGNWDSSVPAADIFRANGYSYYLWPNASLKDYCCGDLKITTAAEGGQVRFGDYAMELDYDYASYDGSSNANYYVRYSGDQIKTRGHAHGARRLDLCTGGNTPRYALYALICMFWDGQRLWH